MLYRQAVSKKRERRAAGMQAPAVVFLALPRQPQSNRTSHEDVEPVFCSADTHPPLRRLLGSVNRAPTLRPRCVKVVMPGLVFVLSTFTSGKAFFFFYSRSFLRPKSFCYVPILLHNVTHQSRRVGRDGKQEIDKECLAGNVRALKHQILPVF